MCEFCRKNPCDNRCPNACDSFIIIGMCYECSDDIYSNYTHWEDDEGNKFCSRECAEKYYGIKEVDE